MHRHAHAGSADVQEKQSTDQILRRNQGKAFWLLQRGPLARVFPGNQQRNPVVGAALP